MENSHRDLILAAEISGILHDLGKVYAEFAQEMMGGTKHHDAAKENAHIKSAHGAILEEGRPYPPKDEEPWLSGLKAHDGWGKVLALPAGWVRTGTVQAKGLGDPLRQHHAHTTYPENQLTLLGDLYSFGGDTRDSAFDKGSESTEYNKQRIGHGFIADSFGYEEVPYGPECLQTCWKTAQQAIEGTLLSENASQDVPKTREAFLSQIKPVFVQALGETRRPTNDVTLWHHCTASAGLFKALVAEGVLRQSFEQWQEDGGLFDLPRMSRLRFRLLGIRWDWAQLTRGVLKSVALTNLALQRKDAIDRLRQLLEVNHPVGQCVYQDDNGAVFVVGGFYEGQNDVDGKASEALFREHLLEPLQPRILSALNPLGVGTSVRIAWTVPRLYLTDYPDVITPNPQPESGDRQRCLQIGEPELRGLWAKPPTKGQQVQVCPQCGLRPGQARELAIYESGLNLDANDPQADGGLCDFCQKLVVATPRDRYSKIVDLFGFEPQTFNLQEICEARNGAGNARLVMISVHVDPERIATGETLLTQLARPFSDIRAVQNKFTDPNAAGAWLQTVLEQLAADKAIPKEDVQLAGALIGDTTYWLKKSDKRAEGSLNERARYVLEAFFLREAIPEGLGLYRHDGDRLLFFGLHKHASPGRLARLWDDLRALWEQIVGDIAGTMEGWLFPLSIHAAGFRVIVAASDAKKALQHIQQHLTQRLGKVRPGLDVHVSALAFRYKFPLYVALDAMHRMEQRVTRLPAQEWTLQSVQAIGADGTVAPPDQTAQEILLYWDTPHGTVDWTVDLRTGDPAHSDHWYPHAVCTTRPKGPGRLVRLDQLKVGDTIRLRPSTFDWMVLDGTTRRYDLRYDQQGFRPHFVVGVPGRRPYLIEQINQFLDLPAEIGWNSSQAKHLIGQVIDCYEKWVRDVPVDLRSQGREAWYTFCGAIFGRYLKDKVEICKQLTALCVHEERACLLFDAFDWCGLIEKDTTLQNPLTPITPTPIVEIA